MKYLNESFWKMCAGFLGIIVIGLISFFVLTYMQENEQTANIVTGIFEALTH